MQELALLSSEDRIAPELSAQKTLRPNPGSFGMAVSRNFAAGAPVHPESVNTYPYFLPPARLLLINIA
jgi:hypothetical protein